jgi:OOP family OmpA-OmpF porin
VDARGCPKDSDGDGVYDGIDQCPDTPRGAQVDARGCPKDSDGDGVYDGIDQCPDTPRGTQVDSLGCPLPQPKSPPPMIRQLLEKKAVVLEGLEFDIDRDTLRPASYATLDEVAASLKEWPDVRVEIQGHTDSSASAAHNQELSNRRAGSVRAYLVTKGISPSRLATKGYGEDHPIADNTTKEGKQRNRRVELHRID